MRLDAKVHRPGGQVGPDGSFRLSTYTSYDGAPAAGTPSPSSILPRCGKNGENAGPDLFHGRYGDPENYAALGRGEERDKSTGTVSIQ